MNDLILKADSLDSMYKTIITNIIFKGDDVTARGLSFREIQFAHLILTDPRNRVISNLERKLSKRFMMGEFIWMMDGKSNLDQIKFYNKKWADFSDNGIDLNGAYGPRLRRWGQPVFELDQLQNTVKKLKADIYSRQAVLVILDPAKDLVNYTKDVPCNNYLQFLYRGGVLHLMCYVRSNDLMLGFPYDAFHWTMLQEMVACELGVDVGDYHHIVGSLHIYNNDFDKMLKIHGSATSNEPMAPMPLNTKLTDIDELAVFEKKFREEGVFDLSLVSNYWWHDKLAWLKK